MVSPYYQDEQVTIYYKDSRDLCEIKGISIDLVLTDPPYGVRDDEWDDKLEFKFFVQEWVSRLRNICPIVIWFCSSSLLPYMLQGRDDFHRMLIWNKPLGTQYAGSSHNNIWYSFEPILIFGKKASITSKGKKMPYSYAVFDAPTVPESKFEHPTSKPESLIEWLILHYSNVGDLILDPFLGSGTTAWCVKKLGRRCIGYEINEKYCEVSANRCRQVVMKLGL